MYKNSKCNNQPPGRELKPGTSEYETGALNIQPCHLLGTKHNSVSAMDDSSLTANTRKPCYVNEKHQMSSDTKFFIRSTRCLCDVL